jgi:hypothetical protein
LPAEKKNKPLRPLPLLHPQPSKSLPMQHQLPPPRLLPPLRILPRSNRQIRDEKRRQMSAFFCRVIAPAARVMLAEAIVVPRRRRLSPD